LLLFEELDDLFEKAAFPYAAHPGNDFNHRFFDKGLNFINIKVSYVHEKPPGNQKSFLYGENFTKKRRKFQVYRIILLVPWAPGFEKNEAMERWGQVCSVDVPCSCHRFRSKKEGAKMKVPGENIFQFSKEQIQYNSCI
jgi:hypothetical protein